MALHLQPATRTDSAHGASVDQQFVTTTHHKCCLPYFTKSDSYIGKQIQKQGPLSSFFSKAFTTSQISGMSWLSFEWR